MAPSQLLPFDPSFENVDQFVDSLLAFSTSNRLFQHLCGGVHILDFLTQEPDLYSTILPEAWREWFPLHYTSDILDLLMREDVAVLRRLKVTNAEDCSSKWRNSKSPPDSLLDYIIAIRMHALRRDFSPPLSSESLSDPLPRNVTVGMKPKKIHEVKHFARYIGDLSASVAELTSQEITHFVDFGSGQNYLGRTLASPPYNQHVVALESKYHNICGAKAMDVTAKLTQKEKISRNKKQFRQGSSESHMLGVRSQSVSISKSNELTDVDMRANHSLVDGNPQAGRIQYIETVIQDGSLLEVTKAITGIPASVLVKPQLMVCSLHSCGNLLHHGLRSLIMNRNVKAVAMVGCCYNLVTEKLGPPTYKMPSLRVANLRLDRTSSACDPHGFPMSERLTKYKHEYGEGIRMNITARMMACQAPQNWTAMDCESFFTRHFYRALLQRLMLDHGLVEQTTDCRNEMNDRTLNGWTGNGPPVLIGSLRKSCYTSFTAYVHGVIKKMKEDSSFGFRIAEGLKNLTNEQLAAYEEKYYHRKKELSIIWSLMAFSASLIEAVVLVDRWLFLSEQPEVKTCWIEPVFDYAQSPRNLVVVGVKKK